MVFLRLTVKVYPPDQLHTTLDHRNRNDSGQTTSGGKPSSFMLVLERPEEINLRGLSSMIQEKWKKLMPGVGPLDIKKLLDDSHESDELDTDMTVADVFVDNGRARADGSDQRGAVRVIQKPAPYAPVRYPSVTQDWGAATEDLNRQLRTTNMPVGKLSTILEESQRTPDSNPCTSRWPASSDYQDRAKECPLPSTEKDEIPASPEQWGSKFHDETSDASGRRGSMTAATHPQNRLESQELVDWASPFPFPPHQGQQSMSSPRFIKDQTLADEPLNVPPEEQGNGRKSKSPLPPRTTSLQTKHESEPESTDESQESQSNSNGNEQDDSDSDHERLDSPSPIGKAPTHVSKAVSDDEDDSQGSQSTSGEEESASDEDEQDVKGDDTSGHEPIKLTQQNCDRDGNGDVVMTGGDVKEDGQPSKSTRGRAEVSIPNDMKKHENYLSVTKGRKRIGSPESLQPIKEPRLSQVDSIGPGKTHGQTPSPQKHNTPISSPSSSRKQERVPSFSGTPRRLNFTQQTERPNQVLGLGITQSPQSKQPATDGAHIPRWSSNAQNHSTPSKPQAPVSPEQTKPLPSAMRNNFTRRKSSEPRSVSFCDADNPSTASSLKPIAQKKAEATPNAKTQGLGSMQYPPGVSPEQIDKLTSEVIAEAEEKRKEAQQLDEVQKKITIMENRNLKGLYLNKLREIEKALKSMKRTRGASNVRSKKLFDEARKGYEKLQQDLSALTDPLNPTPDSVGKKNASQWKQVKAASPNASHSITDPELPAMKQKPVQRAITATRSSATASKQPTSKETVINIESESDSEDSDEDSDEDSAFEDNGQPPSSNASSIQHGKDATARPRSKTLTTPSGPALSSVWPRLPAGSRMTRPSLKSIKADQKKQQQRQQEETQSKVRGSQSNRNDVFDGPSDSGSDSESDSESESEGSSESGSEGGDIQSSGRVDKLTPKRR